MILLGVAASAVTAVVISVPGRAQAHKDAAQQVAAQSLIDTEFDRLSAHALPRFVPFSVSPKIVVPLPSEAKSILPSGAEGRCKSTMSADYTPTCLFGPAAATTKIALVGDSHIEQYLPAFEQIAKTDSMPVDYQLDSMGLTDSATLIATEDWFWTEQTCPAVIGNVLVYLDEQHASLLYAQTLAWELWREVPPYLD